MSGFPDISTTRQDRPDSEIPLDFRLWVTLQWCLVWALSVLIGPTSSAMLSGFVLTLTHLILKAWSVGIFCDIFRLPFSGTLESFGTESDWSLRTRWRRRRGKGSPSQTSTWTSTHSSAQRWTNMLQHRKVRRLIDNFWDTWYISNQITGCAFNSLSTCCSE